VFETAKRLLADGRDQQEVLHMLASTVAGLICAATHDQRAYDRSEHVAALAALPGSWDQLAASARAHVRHGRQTGHRAAPLRTTAAAVARNARDRRRRHRVRP
jgi:hypothetical protein